MHEIHLLQFWELVPASPYPPIVTVQASPIRNPETSDETLYSRAGPLYRGTGDIEQPTDPGQTSPTTVRLAQLQVRENPGAARLTGEGFYELTEDMEEDMLKEVFKFRDPELVQLNEIDEAEEAVQGHPGREQLNESFIFSDPEQLNDEFGFQGAAQTDTELEQFIESNSSLKKRS